MTKFILKYFLSHLILFFWLGILAIPLVLLHWLSQQFPFLKSAVSGLGGPYALVWIFVSIWLFKTTEYNMFEKDQPFLTAVKHTWYEVRFRLAYLPLIGRWFTPKMKSSQIDDGNSMDQNI